MSLSTGQLRRGIGLCCVLVCLAIYSYWGVWLPLHASGYDFTGPYEAAYALAHHAPLQVYDVPAQRAYNDAVLHLPGGPSDFRWTPPTAVLLLPLGLLPYSTARAIWWVVSQAALLMSLWLLARCAVAAAAAVSRSRFPVSSKRAAFVTLFCAATIAQPVTDSLRLGQSTTILLLGFALVAYGEVFDHQWISGIGLGIAILDKLFPGALALFFLWRGRYRLCAVAAGFVALLALVALPVTGIGMYGAFAVALRTYSNTPNAGPVNLSLYHALIVGLSALLRPGQPEPSSGLLPALAMLLCAALFAVLLLAQGRPDALRWVRQKRDAPATEHGNGAGPRPRRNGSDGRRDRLFAVSWAVCSLLALEPIDWIFYYVLLLVPLAWLLTRPDRATAGQSTGTGARWWWLAALLAYFVATLPLPLDSRIASPMSPAFVVGICVRPAALLVVWMAHAASAYRWRQSPASSTPTISTVQEMVG